MEGDIQNQQAPMSAETAPKSDTAKSKSVLFIFVVLLLAVVVAALLVKKTGSVQDIKIPEMSGQEAAPEVEAITSTSTDLSDIESDLESINIDDLDIDLQ